MTPHGDRDTVWSRTRHAGLSPAERVTLSGVSRANPGALDSLPGNRTCRLCGAATRFSHTAYVRAGESVALYVCTSCGTAYRGGVRGGDQPGGSARAGGRERKRPPVDEGPPANPVLDEATARLLREALGGQ
jgi:rubredoxin